jgi:hypothetical protein
MIEPVGNGTIVSVWEQSSFVVIISSSPAKFVLGTAVTEIGSPTKT